MSILKKATAAAATIAMASSFTPSASLTVSSTSFANNVSIPAKYSCEGTEASPPLHIGNIPAGTKSLAIIVHDPDAQHPGGFTHWVVWNIDPATVDIEENFKGAQQGFNGEKKPGYKGICPPSGTHHYHFKVYALDVVLTIDKTSGKAELEAAMKGHTLGEGDLVGLYAKTK